MKRANKLLMVFFSLVLCLGLGWNLQTPSADGSQTGTQAATSDSKTTFDMEVYLDHFNAEVQMAVTGCPIGAPVVIEVDLYKYSTVNTKNTKHYLTVHPTAGGVAHFSSGFYVDPNIESSFTIRAFSLDSTGSLIASAHTWGIKTTPNLTFQKAAELAPEIAGALEAAHRVRGSDPLGAESFLLDQYYSHSRSGAFIANTTSSPTLKGNGVWATALPQASFRASAGPAGVFTAN